MAASEKEYENGFGAMPAKARTAASEKGYENRTGAMLAKARTAASEKGPPMTKWATSGRRSTLSSKDVWDASIK